jgi:hypothetical protein
VVGGDALLHSRASAYAADGRSGSCDSARANHELFNDVRRAVLYCTGQVEYAVVTEQVADVGSHQAYKCPDDLVRFEFCVV